MRDLFVTGARLIGVVLEALQIADVVADDLQAKGEHLAGFHRLPEVVHLDVL